MTPEQKEVFRLLLASLKDNLNATLTPNDSRIILEMLKDVPIVNRQVNRQVNPPKSVKPPLIKRFHATANLVLDTIDELAGEIDDFRKEMKRK